MHDVKGTQVDAQTRCVHYHSDIDIIALKFHCCGTFYACWSCHEEHAGHKPSRWPREQWNQRAVLCGNCGYEMTIQEYMNTSSCSSCSHRFNERCSLHYPLYFDMESRP
ncbi:hypothetical protein JF544_11495 [Halobacillus kuroshimensis]|uniref:CHY-type domain-containing protein n=1 Tax=Halobacillus kuroshimensis TaxID=302481 RepID=A0ABS3DX37_9BACI|nr:CHY zinc finger protein [Halobacillus kuroshimensis]MBN8235878.1 hypothetical protein [Halobacillus kuroshimensis]